MAQLTVAKLFRYMGQLTLAKLFRYMAQVTVEKLFRYIGQECVGGGHGHENGALSLGHGTVTQEVGKHVELVKLVRLVNLHGAKSPIAKMGTHPNWI